MLLNFYSFLLISILHILKLQIHQSIISVHQLLADKKMASRAINW